MLDEDTTSQARAVAEALQQLKREVHRQRLELAGRAPAEGVQKQEIPWPATLERVHAAARVNPHLPIGWPTWPRGLWPKITTATQKIVRRLLRWYINPIVEQQNRFNMAVAQSLDLLWQEIASLKMQISPDEHPDRPGGE